MYTSNCRNGAVVSSPERLKLCVVLGCATHFLISDSDLRLFIICPQVLLTAHLKGSSLSLPPESVRGVKMLFRNEDMAKWVLDVAERICLQEVYGGVLRFYAEKYFNSTRRTDESTLWINYAKPDAMCDQYVILS